MTSLIICCGVLGAASGAVTPRIAYRLAVSRGRPRRSSCDRCATPFPPGLASWVRAGSSCRRSPSRLAWLPAAAGALVAGSLGAALGVTPALPGFLAASALGILLAAIDLRCLRLPDPLVGALLLATAGVLAAGPPDRAVQAAMAGLACGVLYLLTALLPRAPLGFGDVKLGAVLGVLTGWIGWPAVVLGLVLPHVISGPVALFFLVTRRATGRSVLPFGPALLAGAYLAIVLTAGIPVAA